MLRLTLETQKTELPLIPANGFSVSSIDGLNPSNASISTEAQAGIPGGIYKGQTIDPRNIVINLSLEYQPKQARDRLYRVCQPGSNIDLLIEDITNDKTYTTNGYVETIEIDYAALPVEMQISIICINPYLQALTPSIYNSAVVEGQFTFPFHTDSEETFIFGEKGSSITARTTNNGTVETGAVFTIRAIDQIQNPCIWKRSTGEYFKINRTLSAGDTATISTSKGNRTLFINNSNSLKFKDRQSKWLQVSPGQEQFVLTSDNQANANLGISFNEQYIGV